MRHKERCGRWTRRRDSALRSAVNYCRPILLTPEEAFAPHAAALTWHVHSQRFHTCRRISLPQIRCYMMASHAHASLAGGRCVRLCTSAGK